MKIGGGDSGWLPPVFVLVEVKFLQGLKPLILFWSFGCTG